MTKKEIVMISRSKSLSFITAARPSRISSESTTHASVIYGEIKRYNKSGSLKASDN